MKTKDELREEYAEILIQSVPEMIPTDGLRINDESVRKRVADVTAKLCFDLADALAAEAIRRRGGARQ